MIFLAAAIAVVSQPSVSGPAAQTPMRRILVMPDLSTRDVVVTRLGEVVKYVGPSGRTVSVPLSELLAILPAERSSGPASGNVKEAMIAAAASEGTESGHASLLMLSSGEVIRGTPVWPESASESFGWKSDVLGLQAVTLDAILGWRRESSAGKPALRPSGAGDTVILANGDVLTGFLETVCASGIDIEVDKKKRSLDPALVVSAMIATPVKAAKGPMVYLSDGSVLLIDGLGAGSGSQAALTANRQGQTLAISSDSIVAYASQAGALGSLAGVALSSESPTGGRDWTPPIEVVDSGAPMGVSDIVLPGPMEARWVLPDESTGIAATLELDPASRVWGDCVVTVTLEPTKGTALEIVKARLWEESASTAFVAQTSGGWTLRIRVDPGERGPVQDRIVIRRSLISLAKPGSGVSSPAKPEPGIREPDGGK